MLDFHTHILPFVDHGSRSVKESLALLQMEAEQGVDTVALTPHYYLPENSIQEFLSRRQKGWEVLRPHLTEKHPKVLLGAEVLFYDGISQEPRIGDLCLEGTNYLLLEMPACPWTSSILREVLALNAQPEIQVVLAHIDRYSDLVEKETWQTLAENHLLFQVNLSCFCNFWTKSHCINMLKQGKIHFLGSDCHNLTDRKPQWEKLPNRILKMIK